jgi:2-(acetamidomethylene)succinate hydrolase
MTASSATSVRNTISRLYAFERGVGWNAGPLALCMHGITANAHVFEPLMALLEHRFHLVSVDQRGHGRSHKPASGYGGRDFASDLKHFVEDKKALLIGHSLGARNALVAATMFPEQLYGVVAIDFAPYIEDEVFDALDARVAGGDRGFSSLQDIKDYLHARYPRLPADAVERRARYGYAHKGDEWRALASPAAMKETSTRLREDLVSVLKEMKVPALLVRGKESKLVSTAAWAHTKALRPDLPAVEIANADHYVHEEQPAAVARAVLEFWDGIERRNS